MSNLATLLNLSARIARVAKRNQQKLAEIEKVTGASLGEIDRVRMAHQWTIDDLLGYAQRFKRLPLDDVRARMEGE